MGIMNLATAAARFTIAAAAEKAAEHEALEAAAQLVETRAKNLIGVPHDFWAPLAQSTLDHKGGVNTPLLESGDMRDSIEHKVVFPSAFVGSDLDRAIFMECGTSRGVPPRSFLAHSAMESGEDIAKTTAKIVGGAIGGTLGGAGILGAIEMARALGEALKPLRDLGSDLLAPEDERR